jgi:hypothetical protein
MVLLLSTPTTVEKLDGREKTLCLNISCRNPSDVIQWTVISTLQISHKELQCVNVNFCRDARNL